MSSQYGREGEGGGHQGSGCRNPDALKTDVGNRCWKSWLVLHVSEGACPHSQMFLAASAVAEHASPPPSSPFLRTNRTRRVLTPVLIGQAASLPPY